ncbi:Linalool 8-monooxygenase [Sphingopyxis sp. Root1497]|uniref:cytochrome P450 n=1 Tax=Sphingopyxis sp. Root1497 TaxID=1736474 RepID=UPI0006F5B596|nr:cytochrome P450 [Sphingopyxis sp. Root1497]KQZ61668.1 Linalool 8-monooxygenase [Sphingopyxis sp. Root1497]
MTDLKDPDLYVGGMPYAELAALREAGSVHWNPESDGAGFWAVLGFDDIVTVSRQADLFSSAHENGGHRIFNENEVGLTGAGESAIGIPFISRDPPTHTQYRKFVMPALSPGRLEGIEARIAERVERLFAEVPLGEAIDILPLLTVPLPLLTLAELLGVPAETWHDLHRWTDAFVGEDDPDFRQSPEAMQAVMGEFIGFATALFEERRAHPGPDIASLLANTEIHGEPVPLGDFVGNLILALVGGNETTRNSINHSLIAFANNPDQWDAIRADSGLLPNAVKEMVRYASPVIHMRRTATRDTELGGQAIRKGEKVVVFYPSGNRDPSIFADPDAFDITRPIRQHLAFGAGTHVCVGSRLAEMQLRLAFATMARHVRRIEIIGEPSRVRSNFINGFKRLEVRLTA